MSIDKLKKLADKYSLSDEIVEQRENDRLSFIDKFPLAKLKDLSIDQFVQGTDDNSFCYWLEFKKIGFGIGGGNASKFGIYKTKNKEEIVYATGYGKNKIYLDDQAAKDYFSDLLRNILKALDYTKSNKIDLIRELEIPMWNMILQKILAIYFPDKFLTIGSSTVLIKCAKELDIQNIELSSDNSILINYECKKAISKNPEFSKWSYEKIGTFIWETFDGEDEKRKRKESKQYWLYAPGENAYLWDEFYQDGIIGLGWDEIGDLSQYKSRGEIKKALVDAYSGIGSKKNDVSANDDFLNKIKIGDVIIAKKGRGELLGYGVVTSDYIFDKNRKNYQKTRQIDWKIKGNWNVDFSLVLKTLTDITKYSSEDTEYDTYYEKLLGIMGVGQTQKDNRESFTIWLTKKYGEDSGTTSSYIKAIDILSQILSKEIYRTTDDGYLDSLYKDLIKEQRNPEGKYYHSDAPSYGSNGFYSASIKSYREFLKTNQTNQTHYNNQMEFPLNTILYGPPGTGKTHILKNQYMDMFTTSESSITRQDFLKDIIQNCSWWQVIALAVLELGKTKVADIFNHEYVQVKAQLSNSTTVTPTIWGQLQSHTVEDCEHVKVSRRMPPMIFNKTEKSEWEILQNEVEEQSPELLELKSKIENFESVPNKRIERYEFLTFHQSYSYEDFIEGIKPELAESDVSYKIEEGVFQKMCNRARNDSSNNYAIFIDEINRGNISSIFGELITLIEDDKREGKPNEIKATLPYSKKHFSVPNNLYIIGTMNTADRSVEALDTALRRRFSFVEMNPEPKKLSAEEFKCIGIDLEALLNAINARIEKLLDKDYCIGHSYFMTIKNRQSPLEEIKTIFQNKILPLLQEYFYGDWGKILLVIGQEFVETKKNTIKFLSTESYEDFEEYDEKPIYNFTKPSNWTLDSFKSIYE